MSDQRRRRPRRDAPRPSAPPIHGAHWRWLVIAYFFLGGIAGAAQAIAALADLSPRRDLRRLVRAGRYLSLAAFLPCPPLLILDLQRPERFLNMLRVLKLRSPMSIGSWVLVAFGGVATLAALLEAARERRLARLAPPLRATRTSRAASLAGLPTGLLLAGYTGVLLAATAVPLWTKRGLLLGPLFLASALSSAAAALGIFVRFIGASRAERDGLHRIEHVAILAESLLLLTWLSRLGRAGRPMAEGTLAEWLHKGVAGLGLALPAMLSAVGPRFGERGALVAQVIAALAALAGGFILRTAVILGGNASAADGEATFDMTRRPPR